MASILLLEAHPNQRLLYQMELEDAGHHVKVLDHLDEALDQVSSDPPDLVVVNPCLAMGQGMWILTAIKEMVPDLPIILYTAESLFGDDYRYFLADACLTKRSDTTELLRTIDELLGVAQKVEILSYLEEREGKAFPLHDTLDKPQDRLP